MKNFNCENKLFKPFKKGDKLLNDIITYDNAYNKFFIIFSTSRSKNSKFCTLTIDTNKTTTKNLLKLENLLKGYTWNLSSTLKTSKNGVNYTFKTLLNKHNINISYKLSISSNKTDIKTFFNDLLITIPIRYISIVN